jgi:lipopolysaccharide biosynthesis regulator YciM
VTSLWIAAALGALSLAIAVVLADRLRLRRDEAQAYLKGVRSMLSGDPDAAIEALSDAARLGSPEAIETYLALGALFRRTGDLARAVRLHRNMLLGPGLPEPRRAEVEVELAEDYRRSGMLAEAAEIYRRLAAADPRAAVGLRDVLVEQGDLAAALEVQRGLGGGGADPVQAHLLAAIARESLPGAPERAVAVALEAVRADPRSADARLALAEAEAAAGASAAAVESLGEALDADPRAAFLSGPAVDAIREGGAALALVEARLAASPGDAGLHLLRGRVLHRIGRGVEAVEALRRALDADERGEAAVAVRELLGDPAAAHGDLADRHALLVAAVRRRAGAVTCARCGSEAPARAWRCRRCGAFDAFP